MLHELLKNVFVHHPMLMNRTAPNPSVSLFVDLSKAYESVYRTALVAVLGSYEAHQLVDIIQELYTQTEPHQNRRQGIRTLPDEYGCEAGLCAVPTAVQLCNGQDSEGSN